MTPEFITFTGLDVKTDPEKVRKLSARYPIEWGILYGGIVGYRIGKRYPSDKVISRFLAIEDIRLSAHLCGRFSRWALNPLIEDSADIISRIRLWTDSKRSFNRVQINSANYQDVDWYTFLLHVLVRKPVIIQVRGATFPETISGLTWLHDESGGTGKVATVRPLQTTDALVGYAGGIGPENVMEIIGQIDASHYYLDMESRVRTRDWLDLDKCQAVCEQIWPER